MYIKRALLNYFITSNFETFLSFKVDEESNETGINKLITDHVLSVKFIIIYRYFTDCKSSKSYLQSIVIYHL